MNIFVLDKDPKLAARYMCDRHIVKMIVESAQMLSTAHHIYNSQREFLYKPTHQKHPCTIWTSENQTNYNWHYQLFTAMADEYTERYAKKHLSYTLLGKNLLTHPDNMPDGNLTDFPLAMPDIYKSKDPVESYRNFYVGEKIKFCTWTSPATVPYWVIEKTKGVT